jgi:hypothetical protein
MGPPSEPFNQAEAEAREHKAHQLADVLLDQCAKAGLEDADVALIGECGQEFRDEVAKAAKTRSPSDLTWKRAVHIVLHRRDAERYLRAAIQRSFDEVQARQGQP